MRLKSFSTPGETQPQVDSRRFKMPPLGPKYLEDEFEQPFGKVVDVDPMPPGLLIALVAFVSSLVVLIIGLISYLI